jgi:Protein of unknown function (DUF3089)
MRLFLTGVSRAPRIGAAVVAVGLGVSACSGSSHSSAPPSTAAPSTAAAAAAGSSGTVWLCRPGQANDPCTTSLKTTVVPGQGARTEEDPQPAVDSPFDCFYVYPTVSTETTDNSDLRVQAAETAAAVAQAAPFSPDCRIWAPMYRQRTVSSLLRDPGDPSIDLVAYRSLLAAWEDYLTHDNDGRPVVFIGHSQGATVLIRLLRAEVDNEPALRARMVSAIILGGNVVVPTGATVGATFAHIPLCASAAEDRCVIAYSTFPSQPPAGAYFGRPGQGVSLLAGQTTSAGLQVACVNPASLGGGTGALLPEFPSVASEPQPRVATPWVSYPGLYSATCRTGDGASWLDVAVVAPPSDSRPRASESLGPLWGYHTIDVNLAAGNLVEDVKAEEAAYQSHAA